MIYIDPPYNTGNDFVYNDKFQQNREEYLEAVGDNDSNGNAVRVDGLSRNAKDSGHYHSNWLNMMYPRLFLARNLLRQDGVILVSIDDNEVKNLRMIMDEIFGEENFVALFPWKKRTTKSDVPFGVSQDYEWVLCYSKLSFTAGLSHERKYYSSDDYLNDKWRLSDLTTQKVESDRPNSAFDLVDPKTGKVYKYNPKRLWGITKDTFQEYYEKGKIVFPDDYDFLNIKIPAYRVFESEDKAKAVKKYGSEDAIKAVSTYLPKEVGMNEDGNKEISELFGGKIFSYPKPISLIKHLINIINDKDCLILDFFAGSGTTADAVMQLNEEDEGYRRWICVQLPELCSEESEAYKAGYKTIAEIGKERIRRAGKKIGEDGKNKVDAGFKVLKLDKSNFKVWQGKFENTENLLNAMADFVDNVEKGSKEENILFELILKSGLDLNVPVEEKESGGEKYYSLDGGKSIVYLGKKITKELSEEIQKAKPEKFICLDGCFQNNDQLKTNISLQMEQEKIDFKVI